jgi:hypothetical protein
MVLVGSTFQVLIDLKGKTVNLSGGLAPERLKGKFLYFYEA